MPPMKALPPTALEAQQRSDERITPEELRDTLSGFYLDVNHGGSIVKGTVCDPAEVADAVFRQLSANRAHADDPWGDKRDPWSGKQGLPRWIEITRDELAALLAKTRVGIERPEMWKMGQTAMLSRADAVAGMIASHAAGLRAREAPDSDVVDAHICCDHAGTGPDVTLADIAGSHADTELALMAAILHGMEQLDRDARQRIRNWVDERFVPRAAGPF